MNDSEWLTKAEAAQRLQTSTRTIERLIQAGKIETRRQARPHKSPETLCHARDVDAQRQGAFLLPVAPTPETPAALVPARPDEALLAFLRQIATIATPAPVAAAPAPDRPWLRVDEAAARSGLSRRLIRQLIASGDVVAIKDGRAWKVLHDSLKAWAPTKTPDAS